jgi:hypothetical protein
MIATATNWIDVTIAIGTAVSAVGILFVLAAVVFASKQLHEARTNREAQMAAEISRRWDEPELTRARRLARSRPLEDFPKWVGELKEANAARYYLLQREPNFLEDLAILEQQGSISFEWINQSMGAIVPSSWARWRTYAALVEQPGSRVWENFERLATRLAAAEAASSATSDRSDDPSSFLPRFGITFGRLYIGFGRYPRKTH